MTLRSNMIVVFLSFLVTRSEAVLFNVFFDRINRRLKTIQLRNQLRICGRLIFQGAFSFDESVLHVAEAKKILFLNHHLHFFYLFRRRTCLIWFYSGSSCSSLSELHICRGRVLHFFHGSSNGNFGDNQKESQQIKTNSFKFFFQNLQPKMQNYSFTSLSFIKTYFRKICFLCIT